MFQSFSKIKPKSKKEKRPLIRFDAENLIKVSEMIFNLFLICSAIVCLQSICFVWRQLIGKQIMFNLAKKIFKLKANYLQDVEKIIIKSMWLKCRLHGVKSKKVVAATIRIQLAFSWSFLSFYFFIFLFLCGITKTLVLLKR